MLGLTLRGLAPSLLARPLCTLPASGPAIGLLILWRLTVLALTVLALTLLALTLLALTLLALPLLTPPFPAAGRSSARSARLAGRQSARQALLGLGRQAEGFRHAPPPDSHGLPGLAHDAPLAINLDLDLALHEDNQRRLLRIVTGHRRATFAVQKVQSLRSHGGLDDGAAYPDRRRRRPEGDPLRFSAPAAGDKAEGSLHQRNQHPGRIGLRVEHKTVHRERCVGSHRQDRLIQQRYAQPAGITGDNRIRLMHGSVHHRGAPAIVAHAARPHAVLDRRIDANPRLGRCRCGQRNHQNRQDREKPFHSVTHALVFDRRYLTSRTAEHVGIWAGWPGFRRGLRSPLRA